MKNRSGYSGQFKTILHWILAISIAWCNPLSLHAQESPHYVIDIAGAEQFKSLFDEYLDIRRRAKDAPVPSLEEWQRLVAGTPEQMRELLATEGYFSPEIQYTLHQQNKQNNQWIARFNVVPGAATHISDVDLRFTGDLAQGEHAGPERIEQLRRSWLLKPGAQFRQSAWNDAKSALLKGLLIRDYPAAKISGSEARIEPEQHLAALSVHIDSGPLFTFGPLHIQGLKRYSSEMIDALNPIQAGEPFSQEKLNELQARLQNSGYFRTVFATIDVDPAHPHLVPVRLDLTENERRRLSLGVGFSTDTGARTQAKWLDRHFLGHDWRLESTLRLDRTTRVIGADLYFPARSNGWHPSVGSYYERTDISGEVNNKMRLDARMTKPIRTDERIGGFSYFTEQQRVPGSDLNNRQALVAHTSYTRRRLDHPISPNRGYAASLELSVGLRGLLSEANIARIAARANWIVPLSHSQRWTIVLRGQAGQLIGASRQAVPSDLLFRTGGDQSVRGYAYNGLGVEQNGAIVGGRVMAVASGEIAYRVTTAWDAAVFHDAGNASDAWRDFQLIQGSGIGARWRSPIGPVKIDLAYGHAVRQPRLHFSIGYGF